ncbi:MAG: NAD(P)/FAD-dependent oxidoreductase [Actinoallomurus sp.]
MTLGHVVVAGASLAGVRAAQFLRAEGFDGRITVVGAEHHPPYDRPPLSKQVLTGTWEPSRATLDLSRLDADLELGTAVAGLDPASRQVTLSDGRVLPFDGAILATGARPRWPAAPPLPGVHVLRTLDDCLAIREAFRSGPRVVIVGAGFIGAEVAASARTCGLDVTIVDPLPLPLVRVLGTELGQACARLQEDNGVTVRCGVAVTGFRGGTRVEEVVLGDGSTLAADLVVVGIGVTPNTEWLASSGLPVEDGVVCDEFCAVDRDRRIYAAGDVARIAGRRVEHWTSAAEQARTAARNLLAGTGATPHASVPYFWSDQYDVKIQMVGTFAPDAAVEIVSGSLEDRRFVAVYSRDGETTGAVAFNSARELMTYRRALEGR